MADCTYSHIILVPTVSTHCQDETVTVVEVTQSTLVPASYAVHLDCRTVIESRVSAILDWLFEFDDGGVSLVQDPLFLFEVDMLRLVVWM